MEIALITKNKFGFVDGTCKKTDLDFADLHNWERCNSMVISWLLNGLSTEISESVVYMKTFAEIWKLLKGRFGQLNGPQLFQLQKKTKSSQSRLEFNYFLFH